MPIRLSGNKVYGEKTEREEGGGTRGVGLAALALGALQQSPDISVDVVFEEVFVHVARPTCHARRTAPTTHHPSCIADCSTPPFALGPHTSYALL